MTALETVEILENIFAFLPYNDLRNVNRVSKTWSNVVEGSIKLQRRLFLKPDPAPRGRPIYVRYDEYPSHMPWARNPDFEPPAENDADYARPESHDPVHVMTVHPSFEPRMAKYEAWDCWRSDPVCININFPWELKDMLTWTDGGKCERTFITQPPCKSLHLKLFVAYSPERIELGEVQDEGGVRLGMVVKRLRELVYPRNRSAKKARPSIDLDHYEKVFACIHGFMLPNGNTVQQARLRELERRRREEEEKWASIAAAEVRRLDDEADLEIVDAPDVPPPPRKSEKHPDRLLHERSAKRRRVV
jgi:hypothetical protein